MAPDPANPDPATADIVADRLDDALPDLVDAINTRREHTDAQAARRALNTLHVGDSVRIDNHVKPRYLHGATGTVHHLDPATVLLDTPTGRYKDGHITCSPRAVHPITET